MGVHLQKLYMPYTKIVIVYIGYFGAGVYFRDWKIRSYARPLAARILFFATEAQRTQRLYIHNNYN
jgi:hypothetical protein